ncbi:hypothetical protein D3C87_1840390 [compost metagenome]
MAATQLASGDKHDGRAIERAPQLGDLDIFQTQACGFIQASLNVADTGEKAGRKRPEHGISLAAAGRDGKAQGLLKNGGCL